MTNKLNFLNPFSKKYKKVLAFDGGGVRAIMGIYFLKNWKKNHQKVFLNLLIYL